MIGAKTTKYLLIGGGALALWFFFLRKKKNGANGNGAAPGGQAASPTRANPNDRDVALIESIRDVVEDVVQGASNVFTGSPQASQGTNGMSGPPRGAVARPARAPQGMNGAGPARTAGRGRGMAGAGMPARTRFS